MAPVELGSDLTNIAVYVARLFRFFALPPKRQALFPLQGRAVYGQNRTLHFPKRDRAR